MDGIRSEAGSSVNQANVTRTSGRSICTSASRGDGIRGQEAATGTDYLGMMGALGRIVWDWLCGIGARDVFLAMRWVARRNGSGEQHSGWLEKETLEYNDNHERFSKYLVRVVVGYTCLDLNMDLVFA